jgi:hypothetical protein
MHTAVRRYADSVFSILAVLGGFFAGRGSRTLSRARRSGIRRFPRSGTVTCLLAVNLAGHSTPTLTP